MRHEAVLLCNTENGLAFRCPCCGRVEVRLGNAILGLDAAGIDSVLEVLDSFGVESEPECEHPRRGYVVRTERDEAAFAFSAPEVKELRMLLRVARRMVSGTASVRPRFTH